MYYILKKKKQNYMCKDCGRKFVDNQYFENLKVKIISTLIGLVNILPPASPSFVVSSRRALSRDDTHFGFDIHPRVYPSNHPFLYPPHHPHELLEQVHVVQWSRGGFGMVLDGEDG